MRMITDVYKRRHKDVIFDRYRIYGTDVTIRFYTYIITYCYLRI